MWSSRELISKTAVFIFTSIWRVFIFHLIYFHPFIFPTFFFSRNLDFSARRFFYVTNFLSRVRISRSFSCQFISISIYISIFVPFTSKATRVCFPTASPFAQFAYFHSCIQRVLFFSNFMHFPPNLLEIQERWVTRCIIFTLLMPICMCEVSAHRISVFLLFFLPTEAWFISSYIRFHMNRNFTPRSPCPHLYTSEKCTIALRLNLK